MRREPGIRPVLMLAAAAGLFLGLSIAWTIRIAEGLEGRDRGTETYDRVAGKNDDDEPDDERRPLASWADPRGEAGWTFDLFTPPVVHLDPDTGTLKLENPAPDEGRENADPELRLELVEIRAATYPLQLVGYTGTGRSARGVFELVESAGTILAAAGHHFTEVGLTLRAFEVQRPQARQPAVAMARLVDELSGEEIVLTSLERKRQGPPMAVFRSLVTNQVFEVGEGEAFEDSGGHFVLVRLSENPAEVGIVGTHSDSNVSSRSTLRPANGRP